MVSNQRGVYGGGVQYFTPEKSYREEDEESQEDEDNNSEGRSTDDDDFEEEEEDYTATSEGGGEDGENSAVDIDGSDMGSMFSNESDSYNYNTNSGGVQSVDGTANDDASECVVESVTTMSTREQNEVMRYRAPTAPYKGRGDSKRKGRKSPPEMAPISDGSASFNS